MTHFRWWRHRATPLTDDSHVSQTLQLAGICLDLHPRVAKSNTCVAVFSCEFIVLRGDPSEDISQRAPIPCVDSIAGDVFRRFDLLNNGSPPRWGSRRDLTYSKCWFGEGSSEDNDVSRRLHNSTSTRTFVQIFFRVNVVPGSRPGVLPAQGHRPCGHSGPSPPRDLSPPDDPGGHGGCRRFSVTGVTVWDSGWPLCEPSRGLAGLALLRYAQRVKSHRTEDLTRDLGRARSVDG